MKKTILNKPVKLPFPLARFPQAKQIPVNKIGALSLSEDQAATVMKVSVRERAAGSVLACTVVP